MFSVDEIDIQSTVRQRGFASAPTPVASSPIAPEQTAIPTTAALTRPDIVLMSAAATESPDQGPPVNDTSENAPVASPAEFPPPDGDARPETAAPRSPDQ